jgi:hypothetical protein
MRKLKFISASLWKANVTVQFCGRKKIKTIKMTFSVIVFYIIQVRNYFGQTSLGEHVIITGG